MTSEVSIEPWPIAGDGFTTARETKTDAIVVHVKIDRDGIKGEGECFPLKRYNYTPEKIRDTIESWLAQHPNGTREELQKTLIAGPARFALDTALWQIEANEKGISLLNHIASVTGEKIDKTKGVSTAYTLSTGTIQAMAELAKTKQDFRWLKLKLLGDGQDLYRVETIHNAVPEKDLIVDANESMTLETLTELLPAFVKNKVVLIEQPLHADNDEALRNFQSPIPFAADESCHTIDDLEKLVGKYQVANLKLDKTGGLTHAVDMKKRAREMGLKVMVGCMASTWLAIHPAAILAQDAEYADLDGSLLLKQDRPEPKITAREGRIYLLS